MVIKNLKSLVKNEPLLFAVMLLCVFSSALLLYFSYGLYQNYNVKLTETSSEYNELTIEVNEGFTLTKGKLCAYVEALPGETADRIWGFVITADPGCIADHRPMSPELEEIIAAENGGMFVDGEAFGFNENTSFNEYSGSVFYFRFSYTGGTYGYIRVSDSVIRNTLTGGRVYSDEEYNTGAHVVIDTFSPNGSELCKPLTSRCLTEDGKVWLWGEQYEVIGSAGGNSMPTPPITAAPDGLELSPSLYIGFDGAISRAEYKDLRDTAEQVVPGMFRFEEISFPDSDSRYVYSNIILISVLIALMSVVNFSMLYRYILRRRSRTLAILRLSGCSSLRAAAGYIGECLLVGVPTFAAGLAVYVPVMKRRLSGIFPYMQESYSRRIYAGIFGIYTGVMLMCLGAAVALHIRVHRSIAAELKSGRR